MKVANRPIGSIRPYEKNPRRNDGAVAHVVRSLEQFGWRQPIVVDDDGVIIAGHTRYAAALQMGLKTVPVHVAAGLTPAQVKAYRIADNKTAEFAEWDPALLASEFAELDPALLGWTEFNPDEVQAIQWQAGSIDPGQVPDVQTGGRQPFEACTFTLHDEQVKVVRRALAIAKRIGAADTFGNTNSNGNALHEIAREYLDRHHEIETQDGDADGDG